MSDDQLAIADAISMYLSDRMDLRDRTKDTQGYRLKQFREWADQEGLGLADLSGRDLAEYRRHRVEDQGVAPMTVRGNSYTLRSFLRFCESIDAVEDGLAAKVRIPSLSEEDMAREHDLDPDRVDDLLDHLGRYDYASRDHVMLLLMFRVGARVGALHALDVDDFDRDDSFLAFHDRPTTKLKNGRKGERFVALRDDVASTLADYIEVNRHEVTDDEGRRPLLTSRYGRISISAMREATYRLFQPCRREACPHDRDTATCEALDDGRGSRCPSSRSPHDVRSAAIMRMRREGIPPEAIEDRVNAGADVIELHYDERGPRERMEQRREHFAEVDL